MDQSGLVWYAVNSIPYLCPRYYHPWVSHTLLLRIPQKDLLSNCSLESLEGSGQILPNFPTWFWRRSLGTSEFPPHLIDSAPSPIPFGSVRNQTNLGLLRSSGYFLIWGEACCVLPARGQGNFSIARDRVLPYIYIYTYIYIIYIHILYTCMCITLRRWKLRFLVGAVGKDHLYTGGAFRAQVP